MSALRSAVAESVVRSPIIGVVRTESVDEARRQARELIAGGLELVEITFTVPRAVELVAELLGERRAAGPPWLGMGTVTDEARARAALAAGAEFIVSPNFDPGVAAEVRAVGRFFVCGALTPSEIVAARRAGADLVKVYPLPPVGGAAYLATIRQPLGEVPMLAAGGFGIEEIPAYRRAGASAFNLAAPLLLAAGPAGVARALELARGEVTALTPAAGAW